MLFFLHLKARIVRSWPQALIKEIFTRGWFSHDPASASVVGDQIRFTKRLRIFDFSSRARHQGHVMHGFIGLISAGGLERYLVGSGFVADLSCFEF